MPIDASGFWEQVGLGEDTALELKATDTQIVRNSGINSLHLELWRQYVSSRTNEPAEIALAKLKFLKSDGQGAVRATVGGVLLASEDPREWLSNAYIQAVSYAGNRMDSSRQLDAQDITGPLDRQIRDAMRFVIRNRRVAALKNPARTDVPQFSERAVFEAVVNAVVHRDYAVSGSHIRLFMFDDRLELYSPGGLCNSMTTDDLRTSQFTRNEILASRLGQCPVGELSGSGGRQYFIERRGEGIAVIEDETFALSGKKPAFELIGDRELKLVLSAASPPLPDGIAAPIAVLNGETDAPLPGAHVLVVYPNKTYLETRTDVFGHADFVLHTRLPMIVLCAAKGFTARAVNSFAPGDPLELRMQPAPNGGSLIIANRTGHLPGIQGRLNPILDNLDRSYLYADNVAINDGLQQPVRFNLNEPVRLTDSMGANGHLVVPRNGGGFLCIRLPLRVKARPLAEPIRPKGAMLPPPTRLNANAELSNGLHPGLRPRLHAAAAPRLSRNPGLTPGHCSREGWFSPDRNNPPALASLLHSPPSLYSSRECSPPRNACLPRPKTPGGRLC